MSKAITDKTILDMVEEGKNNFVSSRFEDAANLFESAVRNLEKINNHIDSVYFSYAKIVSLNKAENWEQEIQSLLELGKRCLQLGLTKALEQQKEESNSFEKSIYMNHAQKIMKILNLEEERESIVLSLVQLYKSLIQDENTTHDVRENFQERIIGFCTEYDHPNLVMEYERIKLCQILEKAADFLSTSGKLAVDVIAANKYIKSASIYLEFNMQKEMIKVLEKALKCSKHGQFYKFGFTKIQRPPRAKDDSGKELDPDPDMADEQINEYLEHLLQRL
ncbi:MAG: hypothetical protein HeimC2_31450 [Candidatus Heimdallarchaeota archaeon LC_2]|nr:MAG: hypothetical protein HeimC2_31450 [Candidatus Heimdallarchaeota archaeon LC_2]